MADNLAEIIKPDEVSPPSEPDNSGNVSPPESPADDVDRILAEFDQATARPPADNASPVQGDDFDKLIADLAGPTEDPRIGQLTGEINSLRAQEQARIDQADFERACGELQRACGPHVDDHFAERELKSALVDRPELLQVWRNRNVTSDQIQAADREFRQLERQYNRVQMAPDSPQKNKLLAEIYSRGQELGLLMNTPKIIAQLRRQVIDRAQKTPLPIDEDATAVRGEISQIMRGASRPSNYVEPPPNLGRMTDSEFREYLRKEHGIAGF
jgi:hypothetical protein